MAFESKDNSGALFKNNKTKDTQPDYTGDAMVNGQKVRISAWIKTSARGSKFMSLAFSEPRDGGQLAEGRPAGPLPQRGAASHAGLDDDVPFMMER
jgi:hypothetical protein